MRVFKFFLLLFMGFLLFAMVGCPGFYDSKRRAIAHRHYSDSPTQSTRLELEEAKRLDRRDILICELVMAGIFVGAGYVFVRANRKIQHVA